MHITSTNRNKKTGGRQITVFQEGRSTTIHLNSAGFDRFGRHWYGNSFDVIPLEGKALDLVDPRPVIKTDAPVAN
jgi:hypothetical protein